MQSTTISMLRALVLDVSVMGFALAAGLLGMASVFHSDIPGHHSATACVYASVVLGYMALVATVVFVAVPEPRGRRIVLPSATVHRSTYR